MGLLCLPENLVELDRENESSLKEQRESYALLQAKYKTELLVDAPKEQDSPTCDLSGVFVEAEEEEMDPLSLFLIEKEVRERRKERYFRRQERDLIRQKRGLVDADTEDSVYSSTDDCSVDPYEVLSVITKDLHRLQADHHSCFLTHHKNALEYSACIEQRCDQLKQVLYIHSRQNPRLGYQQGMHDLASILMLVMERDVFEHTESSICCQDEYILHDTYSMLSFVLYQLHPAYGVSEHAHETPVETMVEQILAKLQFVAGDSSLYLHLKQMNLPPELFCARWVRLMFSREVVDSKEVLTMWDIFLDASTKHSTILSLGDASKYTRPGMITNPLVMGQCTLMQVLETCAASYIWLHREKILSDRPSCAFRYLVNLQPQKSSGRLLSTLLSSLRRFQHGTLPTPKGTSSPRSVLNVLNSSMRNMLRRDSFRTRPPPPPLSENESTKRPMSGSSMIYLALSKRKVTPKDTNDGPADAMMGPTIFQPDELSPEVVATVVSSVDSEETFPTDGSTVH
jgi:hypothetical protein